MCVYKWLYNETQIIMIRNVPIFTSFMFSFLQSDQDENNGCFPFGDLSVWKQ